MKISNQQLSSFQKQQYTQYLESQLQKFSMFMLNHKKDEQRNKYYENIINNMSQQISKMGERIKMLEFYQKENFRQCQNMQNEKFKNCQFDNRLKKVQSQYFQRTVQDRNKQNNGKIANYCKTDKNYEQIEEYVQNLNKETNRKIKKIQKDVQSLYQLYEKDSQSMGVRAYKNRQSQPITTNYSQANSNHQQSNYQHTQSVTKVELKATENKIYDIFDRKFMKIQKMIRKSLRSSKSPNHNLNDSKPLSQNILAKQQTFGVDFQGQTHRSDRNFNKNKQLFQGYAEKQYDEYELALSQVKNSMNDKSYSISESSQRLKPVTHATHQTIESNSIKNSKVSKKSKKNIKQKSVSRSRSKSAKSNIQKSVSRSKSKSTKRKDLKKPEISKIAEFKQHLQKPEHKRTHKQSISPSLTPSRSPSLSPSLSPNSKTKTKKFKKAQQKSKKSKKSKKSEISMSQSHSVSKSRSKSIKNEKAHNFHSNKQYLMHCKKDHFRSLHQNQRHTNIHK